MDTKILDFLRELGYENLPTTAYDIIDQCGDWYRAREKRLHTRTRLSGETYRLEQMGFAKRGCADDANLCEVIGINAGGGNEEQRRAIVSLLGDNAFDTLFRRQLELCSAQGTVAAYWRVEGAEEWTDGSKAFLRGGRIRLNPVGADGYIPLTVDGEDVTEAAFVGESRRRGRRQVTLVICAKAETGRYQYRTVVFDKDYRVLSDRRAELGPVKPFSVMRTACVNTLEDMPGFGMPKIVEAVPVLMGLDQAFTALLGDIDTADKIVLINEVLCGFRKDENGEIKPIPPNEQLKRRFVMYGRDKLPDEKGVISEIVPTIRVEAFREALELLLSLFSMMFGYGTRKYSFVQGRMETATQYIGERQDQLQDLNRQRHEAARYIRELVRAGLWFMNAFEGTAWDIDAPALVEFDDSYITDKRTALEDIREDVLAGIGGRFVRELYLKKRYSLSDQEAALWAGPADGGPIPIGAASLQGPGEQG